MSKTPHPAPAPRLDLVHRPRRNRKAEWARRLVRENVLTTNDLIWPLFLVEGDKTRMPVAAMPGVERLSVDEAVREAERAVKLGIPAIAFFPYTEAEPQGRARQRGVQRAQSRLPRLPRDQEGVSRPRPRHRRRARPLHQPRPRRPDGGRDDPQRRDASRRWSRQALNQARAGADVIAPSDMMDGRVGAIREALDAEGFIDVQIMAYAAKYASRLLRPVPRRGRLDGRAARATSAPIRWTPPIPTRRCARSSSTSTRAPTW